MDFTKIFIEHMLYPAMRLMKGNKTLKYCSEMKKTQYLSRDELLDLQREKLRSLLLDCVENVPAYQSYVSLKPLIEKDPFEALSKFPILEKSDFRKHPLDFIHKGASKEGLIENKSGGSTGENTSFYLDRITVEHFEAARWRGLGWHGITPGSRSVMLWGNPIELSRENQEKYQEKERKLKNRILIPAYALDSNSIRDYVNKIRLFKPEYLYGYASALNAFSLLMLKNDLSLDIKLKAVVSTAETLFDFQRENIEKAFGCKVVNEYGARDGGILAYECQCGNLHVSFENAVMEVVDDATGSPVSDFQEGSILITDLNNHSMPRLRYRLGDRVRLSEKTCSCGVVLPVMDSVCGRDDEMLETPGGLMVHGHLLAKLASFYPCIKKFQIKQIRKDYAELKVVKSEGATPEEVEEFVNELKNRMPEVNIQVELCEDIPAAKSGKFRYTIGMNNKITKEAKGERDE